MTDVPLVTPVRSAEVVDGETPESTAVLPEPVVLPIEDSYESQSPPPAQKATPKPVIPLAYRKLKEFNTSGPKCHMRNPLGRRAPLPECENPGK